MAHHHRQQQLENGAELPVDRRKLFEDLVHVSDASRLAKLKFVLGAAICLSGTMNRNLAFWTAFVSAFVASALALRVALRLGLAAHSGGDSFVSELPMQSRVAAVAGLAALVSAIAQIIQKASK